MGFDMVLAISTHSIAHFRYSAASSLAGIPVPQKWTLLLNAGEICLVPVSELGHSKKEIRTRGLELGHHPPSKKNILRTENK